MHRQDTFSEYAVVGNPVEHSLSPVIHAFFAEQTAQPLTYGRLLAPMDEFEATVEGFFAAGGHGLNVTLPFKGAAARWVAELDPQAQAAAAVNTIVPGGSGAAQSNCKGYNTDGQGLLIDLVRCLRGGLGGARILVLGAGGAVRGIAQPLLDELPQRLVLANRSAGKAADLARALPAPDPAVQVQACGLDAISGPFDLVVNGTSAGLTGAVPAVSGDVVKGAFCYDLVYSAGSGGATAFCRWAQAAGAAGFADGLGMLVEQAALAFELWRGVLPDTAPVLAALTSDAAGGYR